MTRNGLDVEEVDLDKLDVEEDPAEKATYTCSICPERKMGTLREVKLHIASKAHKKRERGPYLPTGPAPPAPVGLSKKQRVRNAKLRLLEANQAATEAAADVVAQNGDEASSGKKEKKHKKKKKRQREPAE